MEALSSMVSLTVQLQSRLPDYKTTYTTTTAEIFAPLHPLAVEIPVVGSHGCFWRCEPYHLSPTLTCSCKRRADERVQGWICVDLFFGSVWPMDRIWPCASSKGDTSPPLHHSYRALIVITSATVVFFSPPLLPPRVVTLADGCGFSRGSSGNREEQSLRLDDQAISGDGGTCISNGRRLRGKSKKRQGGTLRLEKATCFKICRLHSHLLEDGEKG